MSYLRASRYVILCYFIMAQLKASEMGEEASDTAPTVEQNSAQTSASASAPEEAEPLEDDIGPSLHISHLQPLQNPAQEALKNSTQNEAPDQEAKQEYSQPPHSLEDWHQHFQQRQPPITGYQMGMRPVFVNAMAGSHAGSKGSKNKKKEQKAKEKQWWRRLLQKP